MAELRNTTFMIGFILDATQSFSLIPDGSHIRVPMLTPELIHPSEILCTYGNQANPIVIGYCDVIRLWVVPHIIAVFPPLRNGPVFGLFPMDKWTDIISLICEFES
eukprot:1127942_1